MKNLLKTASSHANPEVQKADSIPTPAYLHWLLRPEIQQAMYEMRDTPRFIPGNHKRHV